MRSMRNIPAS
ncbi:hypothetical protein LINPERHAP1_LOCUS11742 [Linum perenne]